MAQPTSAGARSDDSVDVADTSRATLSPTSPTHNAERLAVPHPTNGTSSSADSIPGKLSRGFWIDALHLSVLYSFAIAQPAFDLWGKRDTYVIDVGVTPTGLYWLTALISLAGPALLTLLLAAANIHHRLRDATMMVFVMLFSYLIVIPPFRHYSLLTGFPVLVTALFTSVGITIAYFRWPRIRSVVTLATVGCLIFPWLFLTQTKVSQVILGSPIGQGEQGKRVPIVMVVFDEMCGLSLQTPDRKINAARFPYFAELASRSTWYRNATTVNAETACVVPVVLTGNYYDPNSSVIPTRFDQNLFNLVMGGKQYEMVVFEPVSRLAFEGDALADWQKPDLPQQITRVIPEVATAVLTNVTPLEFRKHIRELSPIWWGHPKEGPTDETKQRGVIRWGWSCLRTRQFEHFLNTLPESEHPALHFQHIVFPHVPWIYLPSGSAYAEECGDLSLLNFETSGLAQDVWSTDADFVQRQHQRYLLQVELADQMVGRLIRRLEELNMWDDCLLIVTADHGVSFRTGENRRYLSGNNADEILSVPLFIKLPGQMLSQVSDRNVESVDLLPTIADVLSIELRTAVDGTSLLRELPATRDSKLFTNGYRVQKFPIDLLEKSSTPLDLFRQFGVTHDDLFRIGPHPELIGEPASAYIVDRHFQDGRLELERNSLHPLRKTNEPLPCYFEGTYRESVPGAPLPALALVVNGVIEAVARPSAIENVRGRWESMVPEHSLRPGENEVQVFVVFVVGDKIELVPCPTQKVEKPKFLPLD